MGRLGVALVLSLSAAGLVSDASAARSLGASAVSSLGAGSGADLHADGSAVDATAFFPEELNANRRLLSLGDLKKQMLEQQLAQVKAELEAKLMDMDTDEILEEQQALGSDGSDGTDAGGADIDDAVAGVQDAIQEDVTVDDAVEMVQEAMADDAVASVAEGVASVQVTLADDPDHAEAEGDAAVEAADERAAATDASAEDEAIATLEEAEDAVAAAQEDAAAEAGGSSDGGDDEPAPIGLKIDRAVPVPPRGPPVENPILIRRGTDPKGSIQAAEAEAQAQADADAEEADADEQSKPKYFGAEGAGGIPAEFTAFGPGGGEDDAEGPIWTAQDKLHERTAQAVAAVQLSGVPVGVNTEGMTFEEVKAAEAAHLATFAEDEQAAPAVQQRELTVDDQTGSDESAALLNQRRA